MRSITLICFLWLVALSLRAQTSRQFKFTEKCGLAYQQIMMLKLAPAAQLLTEEKQADPQNLIPHLLENYIDFFVLFFNENKKDYDRLKPNKSKRLGLMKDGPAQSPFTRFSQAIIHLQWATIEMKFNDRWAGGWDFRDAFKLANTNRDMFPAFSPNEMITGPMKMVAATVPKSMKWLAGMLGISGSVADGKQQLDRFLNATDSWAKLYKNEGIFYQCYLQFYLLNQPDEALGFIDQHRLDLVHNHLFAFMAANLNLNNRRSALTQQIVKNRMLAPAYLTTPLWDFEMAHARLYQLQPDASLYFQKFLQAFAGNFYVKDAWLKLGYAYLLAGNRPQYLACMQNVIQLGTAVSEADKRALKEAKQKKEPNLVLLRARLLTDGGYPAEAMKVLQGKSSRDFADPAEQLEFMYRLARIYDDLQQDQKALETYDATIAAGRYRTEYFAARAALQAGMICEKLGQYNRAVAYFENCIEMENHDYEESLEQKAKAGIERNRTKR